MTIKRRKRMINSKYDGDLKENLTRMR